jgi:hypothetical protein
MEILTDIKQSRLQKDGCPDVTSDDVSVKLSDTGSWCSHAPVLDGNTGESLSYWVALLMRDPKASARSESELTSDSWVGNY